MTSLPTTTIASSSMTTLTGLPTTHDCANRDDSNWPIDPKLIAETASVIPSRRGRESDGDEESQASPHAQRPRMERPNDTAINDVPSNGSEAEEEEDLQQSIQEDDTTEVSKLSTPDNDALQSDEEVEEAEEEVVEEDEQDEQPPKPKAKRVPRVVESVIKTRRQAGASLVNQDNGVGGSVLKKKSMKSGKGDKGSSKGSSKGGRKSKK